MTRLSSTLAAALLAVLVAPVEGQRPARDTLRLADLQAAAAGADPRQRQIDLQRSVSALRLRNFAAERLPSLTIEGMGQYQSDVTTIPIRLPNVSVPTPPHDTYDARLVAQLRLLDPSLDARRGVERAQLAEAEARVRTSVYGIRAEVNEAFFSAALMQARAGELAAVMADLEAQLRVAQARVREGTALASEAAMLQAELLRRRQDLDELRVNRGASLAVLSTLTGRTLAPTDTLILPDLGRAVALARDSGSRARPEYEQFARTRERLKHQERVIVAGSRPRMSAFARTGYAKPGLNFLSDRFDSYWLTGVQFQWTPWSWGSSERERETLALQQEIVTSDEQAFTAGMRREVERLLADVDRLESALRTDDEIIALRERIERETRRRFAESVITAAEYVDRRNDVLASRLARATHEVELAQARARYLTTIGWELR